MTDAEFGKLIDIDFELHDHSSEDLSNLSGQNAASKLGVSEERVFKTMLIITDEYEFIVALIPSSSKLHTRKLAKLCGAKKASFAALEDVERYTGYEVGAVSPIGQKFRHRTFIDSTAEQHETIFVSAGQKGIEIELKPQDLIFLIGATISDIKKSVT